MGARSKGCLTCKARKIKCTEEHPICQQCVKGNRKCGGYKVAVRFIDENPRIRRKGEVEAVQINDMFSATNSISTPIQHQNFMRFLAIKLSGSSNCCGVESDPRIWIHEMENMPDRSLDALGAIFYGLANHVQEIVVLALGIYGQALGEMRRKLAGGERCVNFGTLASITTLCMFELANFRSGNGWILHAQCLERLLDADEPPRQRDAPRHSLFLVQRTLIVSQAIVCERKTILNQPKWKSLPWAEDPSSKPPFEQLIDIYCDIAAVRADIKELRGSFDVKRQSAVLEKTLALIAELDSWWHSWVEMNPQLCIEVETKPESTRLCDTDGPLYSRSLEYSSVDSAFAVCSYDGARILLLQALRCSGGTQSDLPMYEEERKGLLLGVSSNIEGLAHEILRSIEYCSTQSGHFMGSFSAVLILDIAYSVLPRDSRPALWLLNNSRMKFQASNKIRCAKEQTGFKMLGSCQLSSKREN